jgi:hypothetical protein
VEEERAHSRPAACLAFSLRQREVPAAARKSELPLSRFPRWGKAGAGGFPPRRWHAVCQQTALAHIDAAAPPARGVSKRSAETPLAHPPVGHHRGCVVMGRERKIKDGRHVGLDFYDLLIEAVIATAQLRGRRPARNRAGSHWRVTRYSASLADFRGSKPLARPRNSALLRFGRRIRAQTHWVTHTIIGSDWFGAKLMLGKPGFGTARGATGSPL